MKKNLILTILLLLFEIFHCNNDAKIWHNLGPAANEFNNYSHTGRVTDFKIINNGEIMLLASSSAGIWRSDDNAKTWKCTSENLPGGVNSIVTNFNDSRIFIDFSIYLNGVFKNGYYSYGVYYSDSKGLSWKPTTLLFEPKDQVYIVDMKYDKHNKLLFVLTRNKLFVSEDDGENWVDTFQSDGNNFSSIELLSNNAIVIGADNSLWISDSNRENFKNIMPDNLTVKSIVNTSSTQNFFWASVYNFGNKKNYVLKYDLKGEIISNYKHSITVRSYANEIKAFNDSIVFVGGINLYYSSNEGKSFTKIDGTFHDDIRSIYFPSDASYNEIYLCTDGGLYYSADLKKFENKSKMSLFQFYSVSVSDQDSFVLLTGAHDNGTFLRNKKGKWNYILSGDGAGVFVSDSADIRIAHLSKLLYVYNHKKNKWIYKNTKTPNFGVKPCNNKIKPEVVYIPTFSNKKNTGAILRSIDKGNTINYNKYSTYGSGLISDIISTNDSLESIVYSSYNIWGKYTHSLYKATYNKDTVNRKTIFTKTTKIPCKITDISLSENDSEIFVSLDGFIENYKVLKSVDGGENWQNISYNLPNIPVYSVFYFESKDLLLIGNDYGVYFLDEDIWKRFGDGLPFVPVTGFDFNSILSKLFISTYGRGIWIYNL